MIVGPKKPAKPPRELIQAIPAAALVPANMSAGIGQKIGNSDKTPIEGFEQDDYVPNGKFGRRTIADLLDEFAIIRNATVHLFRNLDTEASERSGTANNKEITARALAFLIAGHELHHRRVMKEKYLK